MSLLQDLEIFYSNVAQTDVHTPRTLTAEFKGALVNQMMPPLPKVGKIKNDMVGGATENARKSRNNYWLPMDFPLVQQLNTESSGDWAKRAFGGTVTDTVVSAGAVWDHTVPLQTKAQGRVPFLTTLGFLLAGYDFLLADCAFNSVDISFGGDGVPQASFGVRNTGHSFTRLRDLDPALVPPSPPTYNVVHPVGVNVTFNDGVSRNLGGLGRLVGGRCGIDQAVNVKPRPTYDALRVAGDRRSGAIAKIIERGKRNFAPSAKVILDADLAEWVTARDLTDCTNITFFFGGDPIGATAFNHEFEIKYPLGTLEVDSDTEGEDGAVMLSWDVDREDAVGGIAILRVRNGSPTLV
jgi:hypothetical protein